MDSTTTEAVPATRSAGRLFLGGVYSADFHREVEPLYSRHMGCENMAPLLYQLVRFLKPRRVLEVGAGFTTIWLLQALRDNADELRALRSDRGSDGAVRCESVPWCVEEKLDEAGDCRVVTVDNEEHEEFTGLGGVAAVSEVASRLGLDGLLEVRRADAFSLELGSLGELDLVWLDGITTDERFGVLFERLWAQLSPGGYAAVHSTLTNTTTRSWLSGLGARRKMVCCEIDVLPRSAEEDLAALERRVREAAAPPFGGRWLPGSESVPVGFGLRKLRLRCEWEAGGRCEDESRVVAEEFAESLGGGESDEEGGGAGPQSAALAGSAEVRSCGPPTTGVAAEAHRISFLEPHKRFQNSFTLLQRRPLGFAEPIFSWSP